jgi:hypothetical protein
MLYRWINGFRDNIFLDGKYASEMDLCVTLGFEIYECGEVGSVDTGTISIFEAMN